jgi:hypothetical protein
MNTMDDENMKKYKSNITTEQQVLLKYPFEGNEGRL